MTDKIKILHLEDEPADAGMVARELKKGKINCDILVVNTKEKFVTALSDFIPDIILCDNSIPSFNAHQTLQLVKEMDIRIPFILVTATMTEEYAVEVMREGANDYLFKDRLHRLPEAVTAAIENHHLKEEDKATHQLLIESEKKFQHVFNNMIEGAQIHDFDWRYLYVNDALVSYSGYTREELIGFTLMEKYPGIEQTDLFKTMQRCMLGRVGEKFETEFVFPDGTKKDFELSIEPIPEGIFILSVDHTEEKRAKEKLQKANRLYTFLSAINQSIVHTADEQALLSRVCKIAIVIGQFRTAWIGLLNEDGKLDMIKTCGDSTLTGDLKKHAGMDFNSDMLRDTPTGIMLRTGKYAVNNDVQNDPAMMPWKDEYTKQGIKANISFPLKKFGKTIGVFSFSSSIAGFFDAQEITLLQEAAADISFALEMLEKAKIHKATQELVLHNEKRFRALIENGTDIISLRNVKGDLLYVSPSTSLLLGYSAEELLSSRPNDLIHPDDLQGLLEQVLLILKTPGASFFRQQRYLHKNGSSIWCEGTVTNMLHEPGVNALVSNFRDISERKISEQQLQKSEAFNRGVLNSLSSHIAVINESGTIVAANESWKYFALINGEKSLLRISEGNNYFSVCEKSMMEGDEIAFKALQGIKEVMNGKRTIFNLEYPCNSPTEQRWFAMRVSKFFSSEPMVVVAHQNITELKLAEENLLKSEAHLNEAQAIGHIGNWAIDLADNALTLSNEMCKIFGIPPSTEISSELFVSLIYPDDKVFVTTQMTEAFSTLKNSSFEFRFIRKDGNVRYGYFEYRFEFDKNNTPVRLYGIIQDVTDKKEAEMQLLHREQHNRALIENITDAIVLLNENSEVIYQSPSTERISGFSVEEITGRTAFEFIHPDDLEDCLYFFQQVYANPGVPKQNQYRILHKQGHYIWIEGTIVNLLHDENVKAFIVNYRDITDRKHVQEKLDNTLLDLEHRVEKRTKELFEKNKSIIDSINYAKRIQVGLLNRPSELTKIFPRSFIFSEPQHIVSGDFFWCFQIRSKKFVAVADCTGHGVPGALMSIIGNNLLNQIIVEEHIENPSEILEKLDKRLAESVRGDTQEVKDGMDIALCVIDTSFNELYFAGALRPLFLSDENAKITELPGNRHAIGGGIEESMEKKFETKRFPIYPGQRIYLTSDGYYSQFGGRQGKKFMKKRFKQILEEFQSQPMDEQKNIVRQALNEWQGGYEQVDDVMVVGIEL